VEAFLSAHKHTQYTVQKASRREFDDTRCPRLFIRNFELMRNKKVLCSSVSGFAQRF